MKAAHSWKYLDRFHHLSRDRDALGLGVSGLLQTIQHLRRDGEPRDSREPLGLVRRAEDEDAGEHRHLAGSAATYLDKPATECRRVENGLRLQEIGTGRDLFQRFRHVRFHRFCEWRGGRAYKHLRRLLDLVAGEELRTIAHTDSHLDQTDP